MKGTSAHVALELTHVEPVDQRSGTRKADGVWHFWERAGQRHDALKRVAQTPECRLLFLVGVKHVGASPTPLQTPLPLTSRSPRTHRRVPSHSPTVSCAHPPCGRLAPEPLPTCSPSMPSSARAAAPACRRAGALEVRYRAAVGVGEEAHSRQRNWCPWSKPVNVETWGHVLCRPHSDGTYLCRARKGHNGT